MTATQLRSQRVLAVAARATAALLTACIVALAPAQSIAAGVNPNRSAPVSTQHSLTTAPVETGRQLPSPASSADVQRYANLESKSPNAKNYRGGVLVVVIGASTLAVVLLIILIIILI